MYHLIAESEMPSAGGPPAILMLVYLVVVILIIASMWKVYAKAGQPGWAAIIPIYNLIVLLQIADKPIWWIILYFVPIANIIIPILVSIEVAQKFGKGAGFGIGLAFLPFIFYPILGFGDAQYAK